MSAGDKLKRHDGGLKISTKKNVFLPKYVLESTQSTCLKGGGRHSSFSSLPSSSQSAPLLSVPENAKEGLMKEINRLHSLCLVFTSLHY